MTRVIFDSGVVFAALDRSDRWHERAVALMRGQRWPPLLPATTVPEIAYLVRKMLGPEVEHAFVTDIATGAFAVETLKGDDWSRTAELMHEYPEIGMVDASVAAIAERLRIPTLATVDRRHFSTIRPRHIKRFALVP